MKLIVELQDIKQIKPYQAVAGWLIGVESLSSQGSAFFPIAKIPEIIARAKEYNQFVAINAGRIFNDSELKKAEKILAKLKKWNIRYYFYTDLGFYELAKARKLPLVYQAATYLTNSPDVNAFLDENESVVVAQEISKDELVTITKNAKKDVMVEAFGRLSIFYSKRKLMTNYFQYRAWGNDPKGSDYSIVEEKRSEHYPIEENESGTLIYSSHFYYLWEEIWELSHVSHLLIRTKWLDPALFDEVVSVYDAYLATKAGDIKTLGIDLFQGALYRQSLLTKVR